MTAQAPRSPVVGMVLTAIGVMASILGLTSVLPPVPGVGALIGGLVFSLIGFGLNLSGNRVPVAFSMLAAALAAASMAGAGSVRFVLSDPWDTVQQDAANLVAAWREREIAALKRYAHLQGAGGSEVWYARLHHRGPPTGEPDVELLEWPQGFGGSSLWQVRIPCEDGPITLRVTYHQRAGQLRPVGLSVEHDPVEDAFLADRGDMQFRRALVSVYLDALSRGWLNPVELALLVRPYLGQRSLFDWFGAPEQRFRAAGDPSDAGDPPWGLSDEEIRWALEERAFGLSPGEAACYRLLMAPTFTIEQKDSVERTIFTDPGLAPVRRAILADVLERRWDQLEGRPLPRGPSSELRGRIDQELRAIEKRLQAGDPAAEQLRFERDRAWFWIELINRQVGFVSPTTPP